MKVLSGEVGPRTGLIAVGFAAIVVACVVVALFTGSSAAWWAALAWFGLLVLYLAVGFVRVNRPGSDYS